MSRQLRHVLDLFLELQLLDRVPRSGYALRGVVEPESVAEHSFHLAFLVWTLAADEPGVDRSRAVTMALVHDLAEVRFGDLPRTASSYLPPGAKRAAERAAAADLLAPLPDEALSLFEEYQEHETPEACFVKACDKLAIAIKAAVYVELGHAGVDPLARRIEDLDDAGFASVRHVLDTLKRRRRTAESDGE